MPLFRSQRPWREWRKQTIGILDERITRKRSTFELGSLRANQSINQSINQPDGEQTFPGHCQYRLLETSNSFGGLEPAAATALQMKRNHSQFPCSFVYIQLELIRLFALLFALSRFITISTADCAQVQMASRCLFLRTQRTLQRGRLAYMPFADANHGQHLSQPKCDVQIVRHRFGIHQLHRELEARGWSRCVK